MRYKTFKVLPVALIIVNLICNLLPTNTLDQYIYCNPTKSLPRGLYLVTKKVPQIGDLVIIDLPPEVKKFLWIKGQIDVQGLLLKPIIAMQGDYVCNDGNSIMINNQAKLANNKRLNLYPICRSLTTAELFVAVRSHDNSLDSRYFGPILMQHVKAVVRPLIIFQ
jgi:type IV secretory pathway protease TraF